MSTGRESLELAARIHGRSRRDARARAGDLLGRFGLDDAADRLTKTYSGGMARKLDVAIGLVHRPEVLFLDEPTTGLDPQARHVLWDRLFRLKRSGVTLVRSVSHLFSQFVSSRCAARGRSAISARAASTSQSSWAWGSVIPYEYTSPGAREKAAMWPREKHSGHTGPRPGRMTWVMMELMGMVLLDARRAR